MPESQEQLKIREEQAWSAIEADDERKHALITGLFRSISGLTEELTEARLDLCHLKDALELRRTQLEDAGKRFDEVKTQFDKLKQKNDRYAFTMVVIDGDNMPFQDEFVEEGLAGGKRAASLLKQAVSEEIKSRLPSIPQHVQVMVRVYANLKGLSKKYKEVIPELQSFFDFVRGFNTVDPLCDFVDAGSGKECADEKIKATFKLCLSDVHCKQIFFGGPADNGYARLLDSYLEDKAVLEHITLVEGIPFASELAEMKDRFHTVSFDKVFRNQKLPPSPVKETTAGRPPVPYITNPVALERPTTPMPAAVQGGYASVAAKASALPAPNGHHQPLPKKGPPSAPISVILRNKHGHRVDPHLDYSSSDFDSIRERKLCQNFHILGDCLYNENCVHEHGARLGPQKLEALRAKIRRFACQNGLSCADRDCLYGHRCPWKVCMLQNCWFTVEMHDVDTQIVDYDE